MVHIIKCPTRRQVVPDITITSNQSKINNSTDISAGIDQYILRAEISMQHPVFTLIFACKKIYYSFLLTVQVSHTGGKINPVLFKRTFKFTTQTSKPAILPPLRKVP